MWIPSDTSKFTSRFKYVEFAKWAYSDKQERWSVFRDGIFDGKKKPRIPILYTWDQIGEKLETDGVGYYTSTFAFDKPNLALAQSISSLYFDLDSKKDDQAHADAQKLYAYLSSIVPDSAIRIYFSGYKGFHIEVEAIALGLGPATDLADIFRFIANELKEKLEIDTIDFACYDTRRMWRIPNTKHQVTNLYKIGLSPDELASGIDDIKALAVAPRAYEVPDQTFSLAANEWYSSFAYKRLESKVSHEERVARFMKNGSGLIKDKGELRFNPSCFGECEALERLWKKAESEHNLEHEERLFLCSLLTYSDEAIEYLFAILKNCDDFSYDRSQSHVNDWVKRREMGVGGRPYSCERAKSAGIQCGSCYKLEPKERYETIGDRMVPTGEAAKPSPVRLVYERSTK